MFAFLTRLLPPWELSFIDYHNQELAGRTIFIHGTIVPYWKDAVGLGSFVCTHENLPEKITPTFETTERQAFNDNVHQATTNVQRRWTDNDLDHVANEGRRRMTANVTQRHATHGRREATGNKRRTVDRSILAAINTMCDEGQKWTANEGDVMVKAVCVWERQIFYEWCDTTHAEEQIFSEWYDTRHWRMQKILPPNLIGGKTILTNNMTQHTKGTLFFYGKLVSTPRSSSPRAASVFLIQAVWAVFFTLNFSTSS